MRYWYDWATASTARTPFQQAFAQNPIIQTVNSAMEKQPLPPFSVIQKYLAPGGSMVIDDETGIHLLNFTLKRKGE
jgi:hypothetical protein